MQPQAAKPTPTSAERSYSEIFPSFVETPRSNQEIWVDRVLGLGLGIWVIFCKYVDEFVGLYKGLKELLTFQKVIIVAALFFTVFLSLWCFW